jgi:large subunit ribosomal protein L25
MEQQSLTVENRQGTGKSVTRKLRAAGKLPGVIYGMGKSLPITVEPKLIYKLLLSEGGRNQVLNLTGSGLEGKHALIKDYQVDPLSRKLLHVDLLEIDITKKISVTVKLNFTGKAAGVADGGVLNIIEREIDVSCFPNRIPQHIDVDVSALTIGDSIHLSQVTLPEGVEAESRLEATLCACVPPTKEEEAAPSLTPSAEPEVITAKAPAEGEAAAGAAAAGGKEDKDKEKEKKK